MLEEIEWARMTRIELREFAARPRALVLLPVGALGQHGPHLPTYSFLRRWRTIRDFNCNRP
jgi:hypothetical protein